MKARTASRLAWGTCVLTLVLIAGVAVLALLNPAALESLSFSIIGVSSAVVGGVVAYRRPANPVGWLFLGSALVFAFQGLTTEYAVYGIITSPGALSLTEVAAWLSYALEPVGPILIFILIPLYFPSGRPVSRRWNVVTWAALGLLPIATVPLAFSPGEAVDGTGIRNPLGVEAVRPVADVLGPVLFALYIALIFASAVSLVVRFRRSGGEERQQIKWFTFAAAFIPIWFVTNSPVEAAFPALFLVMDALVIAAVPVAAGISILRYRLYDIVTTQGFSR